MKNKSKLKNLWGLSPRNVMIAGAVMLSNYVKGEIEDFKMGDLEDTVQETTTSIIDIVGYIIGGVLAIGLIVVVYMVATSHPKARDYIIGWFIALVVYIIAWQILK
jgi:hypothetical protein